MSKVSKIFSKKEKLKISEAIQQAEQITSGEIKVHIENHCSEDPLQRAIEVFGVLNLHQTKERNGVIIYLAILDRKFAIYGDEGIDKATSEDFWDSIKEETTEYFKNNRLLDGILCAIDQVGDKLATCFPYQSDDINELSNEISFYDN